MGGQQLQNQEGTMYRARAEKERCRAKARRYEGCKEKAGSEPRVAGFGMTGWGGAGGARCCGMRVHVTHLRRSTEGGMVTQR